MKRDALTIAMAFFLVLASLLVLAIPRSAIPGGRRDRSPRNRLDTGQRDAQWDSWKQALSDSCEKTLRLVRENKNADAAQEFQTHFEPIVKKIHAKYTPADPQDCEKTGSCDVRCSRATALYRQTLLTSKDLTAFKPELSQRDLTALRQQLADLRAD